MPLFQKRPPANAASSDLALRQVLAVSKPRRFPSARQWAQTGRVLTGGEKRWLAGLLAGAVLMFGFSLVRYVSTHQVETPAVGGEYTEALVGEPQLINPLYAPANDVDADIARLVYSGLLRWDPRAGLVNDLAEQYEVSEDGRVHTIVLRDDARFHNGRKVGAEDVLFTFGALKNPAYRSPLTAAYQQVEWTQTDDHTITFTLPEPSAAFPHALTVGILPSEVWMDVAPRNAPLAGFNLRPVGSGPFRFKELTKDQLGAVRTLVLERNGDYYGDPAYLETVTFKFYADAGSAARAVSARNVEGMGFVPPELDTEVERAGGVEMLRPAMPRVTALLFNQRAQPLFQTKAVRQAVALAVDRADLVREALNGHGEPLATPVLPEALAEAGTPAVPARDTATANALLDEAGFPWPEGEIFRLSRAPRAASGSTPAEDPSTIPPLSFTLTTVQTPEFVRAAERLAGQLADVGIDVQVVAVAQADFFRDAIEPRAYEALLTGMLSGADLDPFPFWHSSQAADRGLNLAGYASAQADTLLADARKTLDPQARAELLAQFQALVTEDVPAVVLYRSAYAYALGGKIRGADIPRVNVPSDRFATAAEWYVRTKKALQRGE